MTIIDAARSVVEAKTLKLIRPRKDEAGLYDCRPMKRDIPSEDEEEVSGRKTYPGWTILDLFTASAIVAIYDALKEEANKTKYINLPLTRLINVTWKLVGGNK